MRQPLREAVVVAAGREREAIERLADVVREELNVKELRFVAEADELGSYEVKPNYRALGPRFGKPMPQVAAAVAALDPAHVAAALRDGAPRRRSASTATTTSSAPTTCMLAMQPLEGYQLEREGSHAVALELALDDELRREGLAREVVHAVQNARKAAGLAVEDRIALALGGDDELLAAAREHEDYVAGETLATWRRYGDAPTARRRRRSTAASCGSRRRVLRRPGASAGERGLELGLEALLGHAPMTFLATCAVLEEDQRRDREHLELRGGLLVLVDVELDDLQRRRARRRSPRAPGRRRGTARTTAPRSRRARGARPRGPRPGSWRR